MKEAQYEGYCVKCKEKRAMLDSEVVVMKNGRSAGKGKCEVCDCGMFKILGKAEVENL